MKNKVLNIISIVITLILVVAASLLIYQRVVFFNVVVVGSSMHGTLEEGQIGAVTKIKYVNKIEKGNIIIFDKTTNGEEEYEVIKRVIATPGDHIVIKENVVTVNDEVIDESYLLEENKNQISNHGYVEFMDITLGENKYYVMGDNRKNSLDSRYYGAIDYSQITGRLKVIYAEATCENGCDNLVDRHAIAWRFY